MTERTVKVSLILAAQGYMSGMDQVQQKTAKTGTAIEKLNQQRQAFTQVGASAMGMGAAVGVGVGAAVSKFADFDQQMSFVQAATHETASNMNLLRDAAIDAGARTVYSATESAAAIEELAKAGVSTADILAGGLDASLDLAAAGGMQVADAAAVAATTLKQFRLGGEEASHVADLLAAGAGKAQGDVSDMSAALSQSGLVANQFGLSVDSAVGTLAAFASAGMLGSDAGTSFRTMLLRLANPTGEASDLMRELQINAYDANGQFVGMASLAGQLQTKMSGLTQEQRNAAMAVIFGQDAIRGANVLYEQGAEGIQDWTDKVNDTGYASDTASTRLDNLKGDVEQLGGALDSILIKSGSGANDMLRDLTQTATGFTQWIGDAPAPVLEFGTYLGIAASAVGLIGGAAVAATPRIAEFKAIIDASGFSMKGLSLAAGGLTLGLGIVIGIVASLAQAQAEAEAKAESYATTLEDGTHRVTRATRDMVAENLTAEQSWLWVSRGSAADAAETFGVSLDTVADAAMGNASALAELSDIILAGQGDVEAADRVSREYGLTQLELSNSANVLSTAVLGEAASLDEARKIASQKNEITEEGVGVTQSAADAYLDAASNADELKDSLQELIDKIMESNGVGQDAISANIDYQNALADVDEQIQKAREGQEGYSLTLDQTTQAGRDNLDLLNDLSKQSIDAAGAQFALDSNTENYRATLEAGRQAVIDRAQQMGYSADEAGRLADQIYRIPPETDWKVVTDTATAANQVRTFVREWEGKTIRLQLTADQVVVGNRVYGGLRSNYAGGLYEKGAQAFAAGGFASGFYPGTAGGIHKFAEEHLPWELYVSPDPAYRERNQALLWEGGKRLGMWQSAPPQFASQPAAQGRGEGGPLVAFNGPMYSYDPTSLMRTAEAEKNKALAAAGLSES